MRIKKGEKMEKAGKLMALLTAAMTKRSILRR